METIELKDITSPGELLVVDKPRPGVLCTLEGPFGSSVEPTRNTRLYTRELWNKVLMSSDVQEMLETKTFFGEADHPLAYQERLEVHIPQISHNITELRLGDDGILYGKLDVLDTPNGRLVKTLIDYGSKLGISSRGSGEIINDKRYKSPIVNPDNYTFITFDLVVMPGAKVARLGKAPVHESLKYDLKTQLVEAVSCKDIKSLESMRSLLDYVTDSEFDTLKEQVNSILEESTDTISDATEELLNAYGTISELENKLEESINNSLELSKKLDMANNKFDEASNTIASLREKLEESNEVADRFRSKTQRLDESLQKVRSDNSELLESIEDLQSQSKLFESLVSKYENMIKDYKDEISELLKENSELTSEYNKDIEKYKSEISDLKESMTSVLEESKSLKNSYDTKLLSTLTEYASLRCESVGLNPKVVLTESCIRLDSTIEDIDTVIRNILGDTTRSRLVESVSPMIINDAKNIRSVNSRRSSYNADGDESDQYLSDITETVARLNNSNRN